ncbi:MAG: SAM-dependent methyltransferase [Ornithinimicrobium sp.]
MPVPSGLIAHVHPGAGAGVRVVGTISPCGRSRCAGRRHELTLIGQRLPGGGWEDRPMESARVPWDVAWHDALYGPGGFYRRTEGPAGHFSTSVGGIPHAPAVIASAVVALARRHGLDTIVDLGAARGDFITAVHALAPGMRCVGVDVVDRPKDLADDIGWIISPGGAQLPGAVSGLTASLVFAHEWLDVVPATVAERDPCGQWRRQDVEVSTGDTHPGEPVTVAELAWLERWAIDAGAVQTRVAEVGISRDHSFLDLLGRVEQGLVVAVDYGHRSSDVPAEGTLTGYRVGRAMAPLPDGSMDLTAHVHIDSLVESARHHPGVSVTLGRQRDVLNDLLGPPRMPAHATARTRPAAYLHAVAEHNAHRVLLERGGFGDFWWVLAERTG